MADASRLMAFEKLLIQEGALEAHRKLACTEGTGIQELLSLSRPEGAQDFPCISK